MEEARKHFVEKGKDFLKILSNLKGRKQSRKEEAGGKRDGNKVKGTGWGSF